MLQIVRDNQKVQKESQQVRVSCDTNFSTDTHSTI